MFPAVASQNVFLQVHEAYVAKKIGDGFELAAGEFFPVIGQGTLMSTPMMQGGRASYTTDNFKLRLYSVTFNVDWASNNANVAEQADNVGNPAPGGLHYTIGDMRYNFSKNFDITGAFVTDKGIEGMGSSIKSVYKDWAAGAEYRGIPGFTLSTEYAKNNSDFAKTYEPDGAKAYFATLKYHGANPFQPGSSGVWVEYKKADPGFDLFANAGPNGAGMDYWNCPFNYSCGAGGGYADNIKGFEYGFETTLSTHMIFTAAYDKLKAVNQNGGPQTLTSNDRSFMSAQVWYLF
jgi:hypothetical protein